MAKNIIRVLCVRCYNTPYFPPQIPRRPLAQRKPYNRMGQVIDLIESEASGHEVKLGFKPHEEVINAPNVIYHYRGDEDVYFCKTAESSKREILYSVNNVETDKPWTIRSFERGEFIYYFKEDDKFTIKDPELNYGEFIGKPPKLEV